MDSYQSIDEIPSDIQCMPVGFVNEVQAHLRRYDIIAPDIDYPQELQPWMKRNMELILLSEVEIYMD